MGGTPDRENQEPNKFYLQGCWPGYLFTRLVFSVSVVSAFMTEESEAEGPAPGNVPSCRARTSKRLGTAMGKLDP